MRVDEVDAVGTAEVDRTYGTKRTDGAVGCCGGRTFAKRDTRQKAARQRRGGAEVVRAILAFVSEVGKANVGAPLLVEQCALGWVFGAERLS